MPESFRDEISKPVDEPDQKIFPVPFAEIVTPVSDRIVAPLIVMEPLVLLYEISIFFARRIDARQHKITAKL